MNLKQRSFVLMLVLSVMVGLGLAVTTSNKVAYAKTQTTMKKFPKSIRGTWYSYQFHKMYRYKITAKKIVGSDFVNRLHSRSVTYTIKNNVKMTHPTWVTAGIFTLSNHERWVNVMGWYQTAGDGISYRRVTHKIGGQKHAILQMASGAGFWTDGHGYHSKHLAKKYSNHYFKGERKNP